MACNEKDSITIDKESVEVNFVDSENSRLKLTFAEEEKVTSMRLQNDLQNLQSEMKELKEMISMGKEYKNDNEELIDNFITLDYYKLMLLKEEEKSIFLDDTITSLRQDLEDGEEKSKALRIENEGLRQSILEKSEGITSLCQNLEEAKSKIDELEGARAFDRKASRLLREKLIQQKQQMGYLLEAITSDYKKCKDRLKKQIELNERVTKDYYNMSFKIKAELNGDDEKKESETRDEIDDHLDFSKVDEIEVSLANNVSYKKEVRHDVTRTLQCVECLKRS